MKIGLKLTLIMIALSLVSAGAVGVPLLLRAYSSTTSLSHDKAISLSNEYAGEIANLFTAHWYTAKATSMFMERYKDIEPHMRRPIFISLLMGILQQNPEIIGVWTAWEHEALEDGDAQYVGTKMSDGMGRFMPYLHRTNVGIALKPLEDVDSSDYYLVSKQSGAQAIIEPYTYEVGGREFLITSITAPIYSNGRVVGVTGLDINLDKIQEINRNNTPFGTGFTAVYSNNGTVVAHYDESRIGLNMRETESDMGGLHLDDMIKAVKDGELFYFTNYFLPSETDMSETNMDVILTPFTAGNFTGFWSYAVAIPYKTVIAPVYRMLYLSIIISAVILTLVVLAAMFFSRTISRPIVRVTQTLKDISEGEGDLTRAIAINSRDEIGSLAHHFNKTLGKIKNLVISIKKETSTLSDIGSDLTNNMTETASAMDEITANVQSIKDRITNQSTSVTQTNSSMENVVANINKLNDHIEDHSSNITQASSAIEEMVANIRSVTGTLVNNAGNVKALKEAAEEGHSVIQNVVAGIHEIARESDGILAINSVMENIASETNLLSMNAAIEAAHAGEAGRGFAVVAGEIRKLAESSSMQSKTIGTVLKKIKQSIDKISQSTGTVLQKFMAIDSSIKIVAEQEENILFAMEEQGEGSRQILGGISNVMEITRQVRGGSQVMKKEAQDVIRESQILEKVTQDISMGMNKMATGAEHINNAVHYANNISLKNHEGINNLIKEVSRFKVE